VASDQWRPKRVIGLGNESGFGGLCVDKTASLPHEVSMTSIQHSAALRARETLVPGSVTRSNHHRPNTTRSEVWEES